MGFLSCMFSDSILLIISCSWSLGYFSYGVLLLCDAKCTEKLPYIDIESVTFRWLFEPDLDQIICIICATKWYSLIYIASKIGIPVGIYICITTRTHRISAVCYWLISFEEDVFFGVAVIGFRVNELIRVINVLSIFTL